MTLSSFAASLVGLWTIGLVGFLVAVVFRRRAHPKAGRSLEASLQRVRDNLAALLTDMAVELTDGHARTGGNGRRNHDIELALGKSRRAFSRLSKKVSWNSRSFWWCQSPRRFQVALDGLEHIAVGARNIYQTLDQLMDDNGRCALDNNFTTNYADLLSHSATMVRGYLTSLRPQPDHTQFTHSWQTLRDLEYEIFECRHYRPESWYAEGDLLVEMNRILRELAATTDSVRSTV